MKDIRIRLSSTKDVQHFVGTLASLTGDFELVSGRYVLDARSLMGIFGLDLSRPLCLRIYHDDPKTLAAIQPYLADLEEAQHEQ